MGDTYFYTGRGTNIYVWGAGGYEEVDEEIAPNNEEIEANNEEVEANMLSAGASRALKFLYILKPVASVSENPKIDLFSLFWWFIVPPLKKWMSVCFIWNVIAPLKTVSNCFLSGNCYFWKTEFQYSKSSNFPKHYQNIYFVVSKITYHFYHNTFALTWREGAQNIQNILNEKSSVPWFRGNSGLQAGIWFDNVAPSPIITIPHLLWFSIHV